MTTLDELPIRDDLRGLHPYGAPQAPLPISINVNENPFPVPEPVALTIVEHISRAIPSLNRYPDREFTELRERLARYLGHGITPDNVWAANGSNEVLQQILQAFAGPGRTVLGFAPTYSMYPLLAQGVGSRWVAAPRGEEFAITPELAVSALTEHRPAVTLLCSPNNPTGTPLPLETIEAVYDHTDGIVVVDEAYAEFRHDGAGTALDLLDGRPRLIVSRTMSKAFAFAGVRLGYFAADPAIADAVRLVRLPYHLSALTQAAAIAALDHTDTMLAQVDRIRAQRDRIVTELTALGFHAYESDANFVLYGGITDPDAMFQAYYERGILVRNTGPSDCLRVTAGTERETDAFLTATAEILRAQPQLLAHREGAPS